jgi:hypothetical protein
MSTFTGRELEFLAGLNKSWWRLYWKELSRLRRIEVAASRNAAAGTAAFAPEFSACDGDAACPLRRRNATDAHADALPRRVELAAGNR